VTTGTSLKERLYKVFHEKNSVQRYLAKRLLFPLLEPLGFHIVGDHFYEPIPNLKALAESYQENRLRELLHVTMDFHEAEANHIKRLSQYGHEYRKETERFGYTETNRSFPAADAISLYCFLREKKLSRVVEVGQGISTRVAISALAKNGSELSTNAELVSIDPYNRLLIKSMNAERVDVEIIQSSVQAIDSRTFVDLLEKPALLFVDSSHIFKPGSDVEYLMREIYPYVPCNTYIHLHDIFMPYPWPLESYLKDRCFWNEQDHLEAFLSFNNSFRVELPLFWLLKNSKEINDQLNMLLIQRSALNGASFYIQRTE
jgi:hypothetical protein